MSLITRTNAPKMFAVRLTKSGPRCPLKVWYGTPSDPVTGEPLDRSPRWHCELSGVLIEPEALLMLVGDVAYVKGEEVDAVEFKYLCDVAAWAAKNPDAPEHDPRRAIDLNQLPPVF